MTVSVAVKQKVVQSSSGCVRSHRRCEGSKAYGMRLSLEFSLTFRQYTCLFVEFLIGYAVCLGVQFGDWPIHVLVC